MSVFVPLSLSHVLRSISLLMPFLTHDVFPVLSQAGRVCPSASLRCVCPLLLFPSCRSHSFIPCQGFIHFAKLSQTQVTRKQEEYKRMKPDVIRKINIISVMGGKRGEKVQSPPPQSLLLLLLPENRECHSLSHHRLLCTTTTDSPAVASLVREHIFHTLSLSNTRAHTHNRT